MLKIRTCGDGRGHEGLQVVPTDVRRRPFIETMRNSLEDTDGNITIKEREPFQKELARRFHALSVGSPVFEAVVGESAEYVESFGGGNVPVALLFDFREDPGLVEGATCDHDAVDVGGGTEEMEGSWAHGQM